jgi:aldehyde:ferredoxin oxidoreductase
MVLKRKIAFINLSKNSVEVVPVPVDLRKKFLGGRGINMYLLSRNYDSVLDRSDSNR